MVDMHRCMHMCVSPYRGIARYVIGSSYAPTYPPHEQVSDTSLGLFVSVDCLALCLVLGSLGVTRLESPKT